MHPLLIRIVHWVNAIAILLLLRSGWAIYNASPLFGFAFPAWMTLGGWLGGALAIHFAAMWLLTANFLVWLSYGAIGGHIGRNLVPAGFSAVIRDLSLALRFRLPHEPGVYNAVQRLMYLGVLGAIGLAILSGLALWKPVQLRPLSWIMGDYEGTRVVHFLAMTAIAAFLIVHIALVMIVPRTLRPMITGGALKGTH